MVGWLAGWLGGWLEKRNQSSGREKWHNEIELLVQIS